MSRRGSVAFLRLARQVRYPPASRFSHCRRAQHTPPRLQPRQIPRRMSSMATDTSQRHIIKVQGPHKLSEPNHKDNLLSQLQDIPRDASRVSIEDDTPSDAEWKVLSEHFTNIHDLELESGFNEELNDADMPLHWPLEKLVLSSACAEVVRSPFILDGRIKHLALFLTSGLRFEGPSTAELMQSHHEAVEKGDKKPEYLTVKEGTPEESQIQMIFVPDLVREWMQGRAEKEQRKRDQEEQQEEHETTDTEAQASASTPTNLTKLEIIENDAIDTFIRITAAKPDLIFGNLATLNLRSTTGHDFNFMDESGLLQILPELENLKTLVISVAEIFEDTQAYLSTLVRRFPPNLTTLRFRGPASFAASEQWEEWVRAVEEGEVLPHLQRLSFVLDLNCEEKEDTKSEAGSLSDSETEGHDTVSEESKKAADDRLRMAKTACKQLYSAAEKRGIAVEPFQDEWAGRSSIIRPVSERWNEI